MIYAFVILAVLFIAQLLIVHECRSKILKLTEELDRRLDACEGALDRRFDACEGALNRLRADQNHDFHKLHEKFDLLLDRPKLTGGDYRRRYTKVKEPDQCQTGR